MSVTSGGGTRRARLLDTAISFAHLAGIKPIAEAGGERREPQLARPNASESGSDDAERHPDGRFKGKKKDGEDGDDGKDGEDGDDGKDGENDDEDEDGDDESDAKETSAAATPTVRAARARERARCAAIFSAKEAGANPALAAHLAFETNLTRAQAIATLKHGGKTAGGLAARMSGQPTNVVPAGGDRQRDPKATVAASWDHILGKHRR